MSKCSYGISLPAEALGSASHRCANASGADLVPTTIYQFSNNKIVICIDYSNYYESKINGYKRFDGSLPSKPRMKS